MTDSSEQSTQETSPRTPGEWLKQERERQGLTAQRIATDMHLSTMAIDAIEMNRFSLLGAAVFAKGHLRKYAHLLGLPPDRVIELYERLDDAPKQVDPVPVSLRDDEYATRSGLQKFFAGSGRERAPLAPWLIAAACASLLVLGGAWWWMGNAAPSKTNSAAKQVTTATSDAAAAPKTSPASPAPATSAAGTSAPTSGVAPPSPTVEPVTATTPAATPRQLKPMGTPPPGKVRVRLSFARDSWVEVYDVNGNRMLYDVGRTDLPRMLDVEPPALVVLGDASAVTTEANDRTLTIPRKNITGTVARFTIAADGSVH